MAKKRNEKSQHIYCHHNHTNNAVYGLGFIGALIYYVSNATGFWGVVIAVLKAIVWPAFLVFGLLKFLGL